MSGRSETTSVLVIRAWHEPAGFRARVTITPDTSEREEWTTVLPSPEGVVDLVAEWAADFAAQRPLRRPDRAGDGS